MQALISACIDRQTEAYLKVAGKLYVADLYKRVFGSDLIPHLADHIANMQSLNKYRHWNYTEDEINIINGYLQHDTDFQLSVNQIKQYEIKYFIKDVILNKTYETPQFLYARIAMTIMEDEPNRLEEIKNYIAALNNKDLSLPSPNLEYIGTPKATATSCCLWTAEDTAQSISANHHIGEIMTLASAGLGNNLRIRSIGDGVRGNSLKHLGKLGYYRVSQAITKSSKQGNRGGAQTTYFTCFDPEAFDIIRARNPTTPDSKKVDGIDYCIMYNEFFAEKVKLGEDWMLISIKDAPDLEESFYSKDLEIFKTLYNKYYKDPKVPKQIVKARELALSFLKQEYETGRFYDMNIHETNYHTPLREPIYSSNLCLEICLNTKAFHDIQALFEQKSSEYIYVTTDLNTLAIYKDPELPVTTYTGTVKACELKVNDIIITPNGSTSKVVKVQTKNEIALCNIAAINLHRDFTDEEYFSVARFALMTINWVIRNSTYAFPNLEYTAKKRMSAGVGIGNLAYELARNNKYYTSKSGKQHIHFIAERHYYMLLKASLELSKTQGKAEWMDKTLFPEGWTPLDTYNKNVDSIVETKLYYDWDTLRQEVIDNGGIANSTLCAHMPMESSAQTLNAANSVYPIRAGVVVKGDGGNKNISIPPGWTELQYIYEFAYDIPHKDLVECYALLQKWCDQAISADYYLDFTSENAASITSEKQMLTNFLIRAKYGTKTKYYTNSKTQNDNEDATELTAGCSGGGCSL